MRNSLTILFIGMLLVFTIYPTAEENKQKKEGPDLFIQNFSPLSANPNTCEVCRFHVIIKNKGNQPAPPSVLAIRVENGIPRLIQIPALNPGSLKAVTFASQLCKANRYRVTAYADYQKQINEISEKNNKRTLFMQVYQGQN